MTHATIGDNNPPEPINDTQDPIDAITAAYDEDRQEAENWTDGEQVTTEAQMLVVDTLRGKMRDMRLDLEKAQEAAVKPLRDATTAERDRWKPTIADVKRIEGCLVATVSDFKAKEAARVEEERRKAWAETERLRREAEEQAAQARAGDIEQQREAAAAKQAALDAEKAAKATAKTAPKGLRTVTRYEIEDERSALHWIARNDKPALQAFIAEYVRKNHKTASIEGVKVWQEKEAY